MYPVTRRGAYVGAVVFSLILWSGCDHMDHWIESKCGELCHRAHDHGDVHDDPLDSAQDHTHIGPSGGPLITLGEHEFHAELSIDKTNGSVTLLLLDESGHKASPIHQQHAVLNLLVEKQPYQIGLDASPLPTDPTGTSSRFVGSDPLLSGPRTFHGRLSLVIEGKPYTGALARSDRRELVR